MRFDSFDIVMATLVLALCVWVAWATLDRKGEVDRCREAGGVMIEDYCIKRDMLSDALIH